MGKQWKKAGKLDAANKKGAQISKIAKEIAVATRLGGSDPEANSRLRLAIDSARAISVPKDTINRAIKKGAGELGGDNIEEVIYEGYAPHQVGIILECQTDNRNRTASDIRFLFKKYNGQLGDQGSSAWMFDRVSYIEAVCKKEDFDSEEEAIEVGANDVELSDYEEKIYSFYGDPTELDNIQKALLSREWEIKTAELSYQPKNITEVNEEQLSDVMAFIEALDDNEDSHRIHATIKNNN